MGMREGSNNQAANFVWTPVLTGAAGGKFDEAKQASDEGDHVQALGLLTPALRAHPLHRPSIMLAAKTLTALGAAEEAALFERVLERPDLAGSWDALGDHFLNAYRDDLALPFARQAHVMSKDNEPFAINYATCLNSEARHQEVVKVLDPFLKQSKNPSLAFNLSWSALLSGQVAQSKKAFKKIPAIPDLAPFRDKISLVLERYEAFPPSAPPNARDWFFIEHGACLLDLFEDPNADFGGRYWFTQPGMVGVRRIIARAAAAMEAAGWAPGPIYYFDRDGEIVARALEGLGRGQAVEHPDGDTPPGLTVMADLLKLDIEQLRRLEPDGEGVRTFALVFDWSRMSPFVPDLVGLAWKAGALPWEARLGIRQEGGKGAQEELPARDDCAVDLSREVLASESEDSQIDEVREFVKARREFFGRQRTITFPYLTDMPLPRVDTNL